MKESLFVILLLVVLMMVCFRFGQSQERRSYTAHFVQEVEAAYEDGRSDGNANCELKYRVRNQTVCN